jgi:hypothetical protein
LKESVSSGRWTAIASGAEQVNRGIPARWRKTRPTEATMNRIGRRTLICMAILGVAALALSLVG